MTLAQTFDEIRWMEIRNTRELITASLHEPNEEIQRHAVSILLDERFKEMAGLIFQFFPHLLPATQRYVFQHRWSLIQIAKKLIKFSDTKGKLAVLRTLTYQPDIDLAPIWVECLEDELWEVQDISVRALEHLLKGFSKRMHGGSEADKRYVQEYRSLMLETISKALDTYHRHQCHIFVSVLVDLGKDAYPHIRKGVLISSRSTLYQAIREAMVRSGTVSVAGHLFRLAAENDTRLMKFAQDVYREKQEDFAVPMVEYLRSLQTNELHLLAAHTSDIFWLHILKESNKIDAEGASLFVRLITRCKMHPQDISERLSYLQNAHSPALRLETLKALKNLAYRNLREVAEQRLQDPEEDVQLLAIDIVCELRHPNKLKLLSPLLQFGGPRVISRVLREAAAEAFERYLESFEKMDQQLRRAAGMALAKLDPELIKRLEGEIKSLDPTRRLKALKISVLTDKDEQLRPLLLDLINDPDRNVRATVVKMIGTFGTVEAVRALIDALGDPDGRVRANTIEALEQINDPRLALALVPFLKDPNNRTRANAVKALWSLGHKEFIYVLEEMLKDHDESMRLSAVWAIAEIRYEGWREILQSRLYLEESPKVKAKIEEVFKG
jgi:HEAT repeat protein